MNKITINQDVLSDPLVADIAKRNKEERMKKDEQETNKNMLATSASTLLDAINRIEKGDSNFASLQKSILMNGEIVARFLVEGKQPYVS